MTNLDKNLKAVIVRLQDMAVSGTMEPGQMEAISKAIKALRRAARTSDPAKIRIAAGRVAMIFLRVHR